MTDVYADTLSELSAIRQTMLSPAWQDALDEAGKEDRLETSHLLLKVQQAIVALSEANLSAIAAAMEAQTGALATAAVAADGTLGKLGKVQDVLDMVGVVGQVVPLL